MVRDLGLSFRSALKAFLCAAVLVRFMVPADSSAQSFTFSGSNATLKASVTFAEVGTNLVVTLTNTSTNDILQQSDILTAVFFTLAGDPALSRISATISTNSIVLFGTTDPGGVVGGEWAYKNGISGAPLGANEGISSSGFSGGPTFGSGDLFPGTNLDGPASPNGVNYGITSAGDNPLTGQGAVTGSNGPLIQNSVVFTLAFNTNYVLTASSISQVNFQYGTALTPTDPNTPGVLVPEPGALTLAAAGILLLVMVSRKRTPSRQ